MNELSPIAQVAGPALDAHTYLKNSRTLPDLLRECAKGGAGITFVTVGSGDVHVSYARLLNRAKCFLRTLQQQRAVTRGEIVLVMSGRPASLLTALWACFLGGVVPSPVPALTAIREDSQDWIRFRRIWHELGKPRVLADSELIRGLDGAREKLDLHDMRCIDIPAEDAVTELNAAATPQPALPSVAPEDVAFIQFSSGSTGSPKGVVLSHANILSNVCAILQAAKVSERDTVLSWMPLTHDMGLIGFHLAPLAAGLHQICIAPQHFARTPEVWLTKISEYGATITGSPNFGFFHCMMKARDEELPDVDLSSVRLIFNGGEPISPKVARGFARRFSAYGLRPRTIFPVYGLAEATLAVSFPEPGTDLISHSVAGAEAMDCGAPVPGCEIRIVEFNSEERSLANVTPSGHIGMIQVRGPNVSATYFGAKPNDGEWLSTGDLGSLCDGRLAVSGRAKDILFVHGQNYFAHDLEAIAAEKGVHQNDRLVVAAESRREGDAIVLFFAPKAAGLRNAARAAIDLKRHVAQRAGIVIEEVIALAPSEFRKTPSGKIRRHALLESYMAGNYREKAIELRSEISALENYRSQRSRPAVPTSDVWHWVVASWSEVLDVPSETITTASHFVELGGDSLKMLEMLLRVEAAFGVRIQAQQLFEIQTAGELAKYLDGSRGQS
jgi:acyl carrier protein